MRSLKPTGELLGRPIQSQLARHCWRSRGLFANLQRFGRRDRSRL